VKEMSFKSGVKCRGSDRWWERRWWLWWGDIRRMRRTRIGLNWAVFYIPANTV